MRQKQQLCYFSSSKYRESGMRWKTTTSSKHTQPCHPFMGWVVNGSRHIQTYAFLDPDLTATFRTENLTNQLNVKGPKTEMLLRTMDQERPVGAYEIRGLEVGDLEGCT